MDIQTIFAILMGIIAIAYVFNRAIKGITTLNKEPKCKDCTLRK